MITNKSLEERALDWLIEHQRCSDVAKCWSVAPAEIRDRIGEWGLRRNAAGDLFEPDGRESDECPGCGIVPAFLPAVEHLPGCPTRPSGRDIDSEKGQ